MAISVDNRTKHYLLDAMGITQWLPKTSDSFLISDKPLYCATCLVILPEKPSDDNEQQKILTGMLNVLELSEHELCIAWLGKAVKSNPNTGLIQILNEWAPYTILLMGSVVTQKVFTTQSLLSAHSPFELDEYRLNIQRLKGLDALVQVTYHPAELQALKDNKKKAYRDLLVLKEQLSTVRKT